jgi:hypothetical protein
MLLHGGGGNGSNGARASWIEYCTNTTTPPVLQTTIAAGDVYRYTYTNAVYYRLVPSPYVYSQDAFYGNFDGAALSTPIISRTQ